jgi:hypothetical protein
MPWASGNSVQRSDWYPSDLRDDSDAGEFRLLLRISNAAAPSTPSTASRRQSTTKLRLARRWIGRIFGHYSSASDFRRAAMVGVDVE